MLNLLHIYFVSLQVMGLFPIWEIIFEIKHVNKYEQELSR